MIFEHIHMLAMTYPEYSFITLVLAKIVATVLLLPATPLTLLSGALLGSFWGTVCAMIGNSIGAILAFLLSRYLFANFVKTKILPKYPKIKEYEQKLFKNGFYTILLLRLIPLFPFNALNFILGVSSVKFKDYTLATIIGILPGTILFVYFGESIFMLNFYKIAFSVLGIAALVYFGKFLQNRENKKNL